MAFITNLMRPLPDTHQEVIWLNIPVEEVPAVDVLDPLDHHVKEH